MSTYQTINTDTATQSTFPKGVELEDCDMKDAPSTDIVRFTATGADWYVNSIESGRRIFHMLITNAVDLTNVKLGVLTVIGMVAAAKSSPSQVLKVSTLGTTSLDPSHPIPSDADTCILTYATTKFGW